MESESEPGVAAAAAAAATASASTVVAHTLDRPCSSSCPASSESDNVHWVPLVVVLPQDSPDGAAPPFEDEQQVQVQVQVQVPLQKIEDDIQPPKDDFSAPPPYEEVTKLPTYEEVQLEKTMQGQVPWANVSVGRAANQPLPFLAIDAESGSDEGDSVVLGTDFMFMVAFAVAFLFNWVGFLLLMCFCHTIAARYGALSGFGLSLAKWTLIVKHSKVLEARENNWLWWLIMTFGLLICVRAIIQYLNIKRGWQLLSGSAQERLLFFY